ncbi:tetratricopeptide repeat protein 23 [Camelus ferus]|nr:tetratricopeptide repeat protein 23 [Camelus ferus]
MQESQETHIPNHLDEIVAAVSVTPGKKIQNKLPQTALFQPPREKLHLCEEKARSYSSSHEYKQAIHELVRCVALTRICYGDSHWKLAEAHVNLAQGYLQLKGLSLQAKQHAEKAKEILTSSIVPPYNDNTDVFKCSVELFHTMGRALLSLQKVYQGQKKSKEALPHYQEALEYTEISKGKKSLECVPVLRELAGVEQALGFHEAAINHFVQGDRKSDSLWRTPAPDSCGPLTGQIGKGKLRRVSGGWSRPAGLGPRTVPGTSTGLGSDHPDVVTAYMWLDPFANGKRAASLLRESLEAKVGVFGDLSPEVAETYRLLGRADLAQGNQSGAHKKLKKCLQIQTLLYGPQDKRTLATQQTIDVLSRAPGVAVKPRQAPKAKPAFCTSGPQPTMLGKARPGAAD